MFGRTLFGKEKFGTYDWAFRVLWQSIPTVYRDTDEAGIFRKFITALSDVLWEIKRLSDKFVYNVDVDKTEMLDFLRKNLGLPPFEGVASYLVRGIINDSFKIIGLRGAKDFYRIIGKLYGFNIEVTELYEVGWLSGNLTNVPPPGGETRDYAKTNYLDIYIEGFTGENLTDTYLLMKRIIEDMKPIYVRLIHTVFSGESSIKDDISVFRRFDLVGADVISFDCNGIVIGSGTITEQ